MTFTEPTIPPELLLNRVRDARHIAVLTGAGMSAESGIPTFRDRLTGLWSRFDPQTLATPQAFQRDPGMVWAWYLWRRRLMAQARPNAGHCALVELARRKSLAIVTQNVDDLHERAGFDAVIHLHGSLFATRCFACARPIELPAEDASLATVEPTEPVEPPRCPHCGGRARPGVVWFGETLPQQAWRDAEAHVRQADLLLVVGTSGQVYPAAGLAQDARRRGCDVAVINPDPDSAGEANIHWLTSAAVGLPALVQALVV